MLKDITLGQYFPGDTLIHRLDPRTKLLFTVIFIAALFTADGFICYGILMAFLTAAVAVSKIKPRAIFNGLRPVLVMIIFTGVINLFYGQGEPLVEFWVFKITLDGILRSFFMILRISMLVAGTFLLTYTTPPISLTYGLELLLSPLKKLRVPVHEFAMVMSLALRFIPALIEETDKIINAQKARGADFETGGLTKRAKALVPILIPLFLSAFGRADDLAVAMESRCYHGGEGRTRLKPLVMGWIDAGALAVGLLLLGVIIALVVLGI